jgi:hypothetical protein
LTAQVAVLNKEAVALASDSAVTIAQNDGEEDDRQKIFTSANKLFALSKYEPVGIMVYGSAEFMYIPLEVIVKVYRNKLGRKSFETLREYATDFLQFLDNGNPIFPDEAQDRFAEESFYSYFSYVTGLIKKRVEAVMIEHRRIGYRSIRRIVSDVIKEQHRVWSNSHNIPSIPGSFNRQVFEKYIEVINRIIGELFEELPLSELDSKRLRKIAAELFSKYPEEIERQQNCGVVIAGYGREEIFPSLESFNLEGIVNNRLKHRPYTSSQIGSESIASVIPFAQGEMVETFMEGIAPDCKTIEKDYLDRAFSEYADTLIGLLDKYDNNEKQRLKERMQTIGQEASDALGKKLNEYCEENYTDPVTSVVSVLPKDELASLAESFVYLTSLKRRYTLEAETVGGAIDVAVISRGDGFIWIKRKHYFKPELNPGFFEKYYKEEDI